MPSPITDLGYRYATHRFEGDGVTVDFEFNFAGGYLDKDHVLAFIEDETRVQVQIPHDSLVFVGPNQLRIPTAVVVGSTLIIRRDTPKDLPLIDFTDGGILNETNLNTTTEQAVFASAEMVDLFADLLDAFRGVNTDVIDALGFAMEALRVANEAKSLATTAVTLATSANDKSDLALARANAALADAQAAAAAALAAVNASIAAQEAAEHAAEAADEAALAAREAADAVAAILAAAKKMEVALYVYGRMQFANEEVVRYLVVRSFKLDPDLTQSVLQVAPSATFILNIYKNGLVVGTINFGVGNLTGIVSIPSEVVFETSDVLSIATIVGDAQAAGLSTTLAGNRI